MIFYILAGFVLGAGIVFFGMMIIGIRALQDQNEQQYRKNMQALNQQQAEQLQQQIDLIRHEKLQKILDDGKN